MKHSLLTLAASVCLTLSSSAEWKPYGFCYVWTGNTPPADAPEGMLQGELYDYNRNPKGDFFTYSSVYREGKSSQKDLKTVMKDRQTGAKNPTNSPDVHGQFVYTLRELINGKSKLLKKYYKYPYTVAAPHFYMAPVRFSSLDSALKTRTTVTEENAETSDFLPDEAGTKKERKAEKAKDYDDHVSWFGIFRGKVIAPKSMTFRFYGAADDSIAVRFDDKLVLETGHAKPAIYKGNGIKDRACQWDDTPNYQKEVAEGKHPDKRDYVIRKLRSTPYCNIRFNGLTGGRPIKVTKGEAYPIEIIIGNNGGHSLFYLLTQEVTPGNNAPLQLFRTNSDSPTRPKNGLTNSSNYYGEKGPDFEADSIIWTVARKNAGKADKKKPKQTKERFRKL